MSAPKKKSKKIICHPSEKGYLDVGDGHQLYYEVCGPRNGVPVVFLHGGPGTGFVEEHKKVFHFKKHRVLFFDQRGSARSKPFASLHENNTDKLVEDIGKLMNHAGMESAIFHGGSWGATLALVFAIRNPKRVLGLLLRGVFLSSDAGYRHYMGGGVADHYPEAWQRFIEQVPMQHRKHPADYYFKKIKAGTPQVRKKYAFEWTWFELSIAFLHKPSEKTIKELMKTYSYESLAKLETYFISQRCFLPKNYIFNNLKKIENIPTEIVHGRYDMICLAKEALRLHQGLKKSQLILPNAGHASFDKALEVELKEQMLELSSRVSMTL